MRTPLLTSPQASSANEGVAGRLGRPLSRVTALASSKKRLCEQRRVAAGPLLSHRGQQRAKNVWASLLALKERKRPAVHFVGVGVGVSLGLASSSTPASTSSTLALSTAKALGRPFTTASISSGLPLG
ncbi:hypothetical protein HRbin09_00177 [bacterium HR09]|nr:hypothetical protein HRbin09_00177 [bacterium HR09]